MVVTVKNTFVVTAEVTAAVKASWSLAAITAAMIVASTAAVTGAPVINAAVKLPLRSEQESQWRSLLLSQQLSLLHSHWL